MGLAEAKLGFELGDDQRLGFPVNYLSRLTEALPKAQIKDGTAALTEMRLIKSPQEIELMRKACEISVKAYDRCLLQLKPGMTRREIADQTVYLDDRGGRSSSSSRFSDAELVDALR